MSRREARGVPAGAGGKGPFDRILGARWYVYGAIVLALLLFRFIPGLRPPARVQAPEDASRTSLVLAGLDLAPTLIPRLVEEYHKLYPQVTIRTNPGGTKHALQDLINRDADVAFLSRPLTPEEESIVRAVGDSAMSYPIALGGIAVLAALGFPADSLQVDDLRRVMTGQRTVRFQAGTDSRLRLYAPDPNLGLWTALTAQLDLPDTASTSVYWQEDDIRVAQAVAQDPAGLGFASTLALPEGLGRLGVQALPVVGSRTLPASGPTQLAVAAGEYPLFHYLYVACRPDCSPTASGFVSFMHSGRGQRLIEREGFLPAREVPREIQLTSKPLDKIG
jgi:phosphate transport system substrate-binding protein